jgi:hypothetical protein
MRSSTTLRPIGPGVDLLEALAELSRAGEAWIDGTGHLEGIELRVAGEATDPVRALKGRFTLLHLAGPSGGPYSATLARASDGGIEVRGGVLVRARSAGVTLAVHATVAGPATVARPTPSEVRGRERSDSVEVSARPAAGPPAPVWARVAAANAAAAERDAEEEEELESALPEAGDLVDHFAFGLCEVLTSDGDRLRIRDVQGPGRIREVSLSMLRVVGPTDSEGKKLFRLVRKGSGG